MLGDVHGVRENLLVIRALRQAFGLAGLALEWREDLALIAKAFLAGGPPADHPLPWSGDGRITAGHLAVLRERADAALGLTLFDGTTGAGWTWSQRDEAMTRRILAAPGAGRAPWWLRAMRTPPRPVRAPARRWARAWPRSGQDCGRSGSATAAAATATSSLAGSAAASGPGRRQVRLRERRGSLVLDLPAAGQSSRAPAAPAMVRRAAHRITGPLRLSALPPRGWTGRHIMPGNGQTRQRAADDK
jgi:hypothetical protein